MYTARRIILGAAWEVADTYYPELSYALPDSYLNDDVTQVVRCNFGLRIPIT